MKHRPLILALLLFTLAAPPLRAQWSGWMDITGGLGGMKGNRELDVGLLGHVLAQGDVGLRYQTDAFTWTTSVTGRWEPKSSDNSRMNISLEQPEAMGLELVYKTVKTRPLQVGVRSSFDWKPSQGRHYSGWITYRYKNDRARNVSNSISGTLDLEGMDAQQRRRYYEDPQGFAESLRLEEMDSYTASCYFELPRMNEHMMGAGATGSWQLAGKSLLEGSFSVSSTSNKKNNLWSVFKTTDLDLDDIDEVEAFRRGDAWMYRITPSSIDLDFTADLHLRRTVREDSLRLHWGPGVRFFGNHSLDRNSGATLVDIDDNGHYQWKDSLRLRENFDFLALNAAPYVTVAYRDKHIDLLADYSAQFYFNRLNDDTHRQSLKLISVSPVGNAHFTWKMTDVHKLGFTHKVGVDYPDYLKICWYDRTGGYADQLYRGNANLVSSLHSRYGLVYELQYKRFRYRTDNAVTRRINEMDQTWTNEEIEGRLYKVFYWINSADSWSFGTNHRIGWEGEIVKGGTGVEYNWSRRKAKADGAIKNASDWRLTADVVAVLGKGWRVGADVMYQSSKATFFTRFNEYWKLNAHIQKDFGKFTLYFDGRDLLDYARKTTFTSADMKEYWVEVARDNWRLFLLGIKWKF